MKTLILLFLSLSLSLSTAFAFFTPSQSALKDYLNSRHNIVAGVTSVGNGGGFGEMQALWVHQNLDKLTRACTEKASLCGISAVEARQVAKASRGEIQLGLSVDCGMQPVQLISSAQVQIEACALYRKDSPTAASVVLELKDISAWVLTARLMAGGLAFDPSFNLASQVFSQFEQNHEELVMNFSEGQALVHLLSVRLANGFVQSLSIEGQEHSVDLTEKVSHALDCETSSFSLNSLSTQIFDAQEGLIEAEIRWTCKGNAWQGKLQVFFSLEAGEIELPFQPLRIVQKTRGDF